jgi:F-type H+-transporting ATPase subunit b
MRCGWLLMAMGLLALTLCLSTAACAENKHDESAVTKAEEEFAHEAEGANRDLFGWAMDLGIWTLVVFLLLLFVLSKFAWKPMMQGLEHRERAIHSALHEAQQARDEAAKLRTQFEEQMRLADDRARQVLDKARRDAERSTAEMTADAQKKIQAEHDRLKREMTREYEQARRDIQTQVAQLATLIAGKVIHRQVNHDDHRQLVDEALAELRQTGDGRRQTAVI